MVAKLFPLLRDPVQPLRNDNCTFFSICSFIELLVTFLYYLLPFKKNYGDISAFNSWVVFKKKGYYYIMLKHEGT